MWKRIWIIFKARNKEFYRDRAALGWNLFFPFMVIVGFSMLFSSDNQTLYRIAIVNAQQESSADFTTFYQDIKQLKYIQFIEFDSKETALDKLAHHKVDLVLCNNSTKYWVSSSSPKGYITENLLTASIHSSGTRLSRQVINGSEIPYIEWLFPGILAMNIMFSSLFGVGYVVVRYRKNGVLKRFSVTPMRSYEFLIAQVTSRLFLLMVTTSIVFIVCNLIFDFSVKGSYFSLFLVFLLGSFSLVSLGLLVASRSSSEEFADGILNLITWPMMFVSEVWFSLEGAHAWVRHLSHIFPLTPMLMAVRKIMNDGATLYDVRFQILSLVVMSAFFIIAGSFLFKWKKD